MTTEEIAYRLIELVRAGETEKAWEELYSPDIISVEAHPESPDVLGIQAVKEKSQSWYEKAEVHAITVSEPLITKNYFVVTYDIDATYHDIGVRSTEDEVAIYRVKDGKIVREEYVYDVDDMESQDTV